MAMIEPTAEVVAGWVEKSTADQGIPVTVTDPVVVGSVSVLLREGREPVRSETPDRREAVGVEGVAAFNGRVDDDVIEDGSDDGGLAGEVEIDPGVP